MGKKKSDSLTVIHSIRDRSYERLTADAFYAREHPMSGEDLRQRLDHYGLKYTTAALWLGLSVDGLHKQLRGDRPVSVQTAVLWGHIEKGLRFYEIAEEAARNSPEDDPDAKAFGRRLLRAAKFEARQEQSRTQARLKSVARAR